MLSRAMDFAAQSAIGAGGGADVLERLKAVEPKEQTEPPKMYRVLLHNDNTTPPDFVVRVLSAVFNIQATEARKIMLSVHIQGNGGLGVVRIYPKDVAETKVGEAAAMIAGEKNPIFGGTMQLRFTCEPEI